MGEAAEMSVYDLKIIGIKTKNTNLFRGCDTEHMCEPGLLGLIEFFGCEGYYGY